MYASRGEDSARPALLMGLLAALTLFGCPTDPVELLNDQFDFSLGESQVALVPDGSPAEVPVSVVTGNLVDIGDCSWEARGLPAGVSTNLESQNPATNPESCENFTMTLSADATAALGSREVTVVGSAEYFANSGAPGEVDGQITEEVVRTLTVEVLPTTEIRILAPADGLTTMESSVELSIEVVDRVNSVEEIIWRVNDSPEQLFCTGGCNPATPDGTTYTGVEFVSLRPGSNVIEVQAENSAGQVAVESVTVMYQPIVAGTARWDGDAGDGLWTTGTNWDSDVVPGPGDDVIIDLAPAAVLFEVQDEVIVQSLTLGMGNQLTLGGGTLRIQEASTVQGDLSLTPSPGLPTPILSALGSMDVFGSLECSDTGRFTDGSVRIDGGARARLDSCVLDGAEFANAGDATVVSALAFGGDASLVNEAGGSMTMQDIAIGCESSCTGGVENAGNMQLTGFLGNIERPIENTGTIELATSVTTFDACENEGTITSSTTSLSLGGDMTNEVGSTVDVPGLSVSPNLNVVARGGWAVGNLQIGSGALVRVTGSATPTEGEEIGVSGGSLVLDPNVEVGAEEVTLTSGRIEVGSNGTLYARSRLRWTSGVLAGAGSTRVISDLANDPTPALLLDGAAGRSLDGQRLLVVGETLWSDGDILAGNGAEFNNSQNQTQARTGLVRVQSDNSFLGDALGGVIAAWVNQGTIQKERGTGETLIDGCYQALSGGQIIENTGTIRVEVRCTP